MKKTAWLTMIGDVIFVLAVAVIAFCLCNRSIENERTASNERIESKRIEVNDSIEGRRIECNETIERKRIECNETIESKRIASNERMKIRELDNKHALELKDLEYKQKLESRRLEIEEWKQQLDFHQAIVVAQIEKGTLSSVLYKPPLPVNAQLLRTQPPPYAA